MTIQMFEWWHVVQIQYLEHNAQFLQDVIEIDNYVIFSLRCLLFLIEKYIISFLKADKALCQTNS